LLTNNPVQDQNAPLDESDIGAALILRHASPSPIFLIYNCGEKAGCSRSHRHMQAFPSPGTKANTALPLFPDRVHDIEEKPIPFKYFLSRFPERWLRNEEGGPSESRAGEVTDVYRGLLDKARKALQIESVDEHVPHNVILVKEWIMVIPRRGGKVGGSAVNAAGMIGMVWVKSDEELTEWTNLGIDESLAEFGVPADAPG
jgi:ATP adenylyltransferase/5',5'''-P-1,P-4-tetraphosphate phosphorylase II